MSATDVYRAIARNLREFGYSDVTPLMIQETWYAMQNGEPLPHQVIGMFAERQLLDAVEEGLLPELKPRRDDLSLGVRRETMADRTPAERRVDELSAELRKLRRVERPSKEQRARMFEIQTSKLPAAWRAVNQMREELKRR